MEIWHRVFLHTSKEKFATTVRNLGIQYHESGMPGRKIQWMHFDIKESDPNWKIIAEFISKDGASDMCDTFFTDDEVRQAKWLRLVSAFEQGYPQPKLNWPIKQQSYEEVCSSCGIYQQAYSYRIQKEPHLGKKSFMSPIWVGELFTTPEVISKLNSIQTMGFDSWEVKIHKTNQASNLVRQLFVLNIAHPGLVVDNNMTRIDCKNCGTPKYYPHMKGKMLIKRDVLSTDLDFIKTHEWFGSGLIAFREILISNRVAQLILDEGWKGVRLKVVELV